MRDSKNKIKTARGRKLSSTKWIERQLNDPYVKLAKQEGYCSRAAYKLIDIDNRFKILKPNSTILDLGSAPGSWSQVVEKKRLNNKIIAVDLNEMDYKYGVQFIQGDFTDKKIIDEIMNHTSGSIDLIMSDMAPKACGINNVDHMRIMELVNIVFLFALDHLKLGGNLVIKILRGEEDADFLHRVKKHFVRVKYFKPDSSRADSAEMFLVALSKKSCS